MSPYVSVDQASLAVQINNYFNAIMLNDVQVRMSPYVSVDQVSLAVQINNYFTPSKTCQSNDFDFNAI